MMVAYLLKVMDKKLTFLKLIYKFIIIIIIITFYLDAMAYSAAQLCPAFSNHLVTFPL